MPITVNPASHGANQLISFNSINNPTELLKKSCSSEAKKLKNDHILQTSFGELMNENKIYSHSNGFIQGTLRAYNNHHHLIFRPDDVWINILTQFSAYVNTHAEDLREMFVAHQGKKELVVPMDGVEGSGYLGKWGKFASLMTERISDNIKDPSLKAWILPDFSTTNDTDRVVSSIAMMASLQKYFSYSAGLLCGLPSVTLLGAKGDWEKLAAKAERLVTFGDEPKEWYGLLRPVLARFVSTFDNPTSVDITDFWRKIAHYEREGSGTTNLCGWLTAFCFWDDKGDKIRRGAGDSQSLKLDGIQYGYFNVINVPSGWCSVPVKIDDNGIDIYTTMVAGSVGIKVTSSGNDFHEKPGQTGLDTVTPVVGWWLFESENDEESEAQEKKAGGERKR